MVEENLEKISVVSFNTRGLRNRLKRRSVFRHIRLTYKNSIVVLQETHSTVDVEHIWKSEWGGKIFFSHGTESGQSGVAIMIPFIVNVNVNQLSRTIMGALFV